MMTARNKAVGWLVGAAGLLVLGACAGGTVQVSTGTSGFASVCGTDNWYNVGFEDGTSGFPLEKAQEYEQCQAFSRPRPQTAYRAGWDAGIANYCTEGNGFVVAANGIANAKTCPGRRQARAFRKGHRHGAAVFEQNQRVAEKIEQVEIFDRNINSRRFSPDQLERLVLDRRATLDSLEKDRRSLAKLLQTAEKRGYPIQ